MARKPPARSSKKKSPQAADVAQAPEVLLEQPISQAPTNTVPEAEQLLASENVSQKQPQRHTSSGKQHKKPANTKSAKQPNASVGTSGEAFQGAPASTPADALPSVSEDGKSSSAKATSPQRTSPQGTPSSGVSTQGAKTAPAKAAPAPVAKQVSPAQPSVILPLPQFLSQKHGFHNLGQIFHNLSVPELYEHILFLREGVMSAQGAIMVETTPNTKLAVRDKFIVEESVNKDNIAWGEANRAIDQTKFNALKARVGAYLQRRNVYVQDCFVGSDVRLRVPFRILTENAWQSLFVRNTFAQALPSELRQFEPRMTIAVLPNFKAIPEIDGTRAETFVLYDFSQRLAIIGGTRHAEEIKKAVFTVMSYAMPLRRVLPMRCAATVGANGDTVLLFGTNGAGKTTLVSDPTRILVGDDAHGWSDDGIFAFEQGSYAKAYNITSDNDASIYAASRMFGAVLENVKFDTATRQPLYNDASITDNARISYTNESVAHLQPIASKLRGAHAKTVIFLVNDAFGVLPPVARLTHEQAIFFYLSGYAAKNPVGMDAKDGKSDTKFEPRAVFSAGFGETFMVQDPVQYAQLFRERLRRNNTTVWLVNTGWQGGTQATGSRVKREISRAIVSAISSGVLDSAKFSADSFFHLSIPSACPNVPGAMLNPQNAWADKGAYEKNAQKLLTLLTENFKKYSGRVDKAITQALQKQAAGQKQASEEVSQKNTPKNAPKHIAEQTATAQSGKGESRQADDTPAKRDDTLANKNVTEVAAEKFTEQRSAKIVAPPNVEAPLSEEAVGKKSKKKSKATKKGRIKEIIPDDDEAEVGDTGQLAENTFADTLSAAAQSGAGAVKQQRSEASLTNSAEDDIYIPPSLFASEQGEYRPDDEEMPVLSAFDDDDEDDTDENASETMGEDGGEIPIQGQSQYRGRRRRGGRGRRRPR